MAGAQFPWEQYGNAAVPAQEAPEEKPLPATSAPLAAPQFPWEQDFAGPSIDSISTPPPLGDPQGAVATPTLQQTPTVMLPPVGDPPRVLDEFPYPEAEQPPLPPVQQGENPSLWENITSAPGNFIGNLQQPIQADLIDSVTGGYLGRYTDRGIDSARQQGNLLAALTGLLTPEEFAANIAEINKNMQPRDPSVQAGLEEISGTEGFWDTALAILTNPKATGAVVLESLPQSIPIMGSGLAGGAGGSLLGPGGTIAGAGVGAGAASFTVEYLNTVLEEMQEAGVNMDDPQQIVAAFQNEELMARAKERGVKRGVPIAIFDAISMGLASRVFGPARGAATKIGASDRVGDVVGGTAEIGTQAVLGGTGEATAQISDKGEITSPGEVGLEAVAEGVTGVGEIGVNKTIEALTPDGVKVGRELQRSVDATQPVPGAAEEAARQSLNPDNAQLRVVQFPWEQYGGGATTGAVTAGMNEQGDLPDQAEQQPQAQPQQAPMQAQFGPSQFAPQAQPQAQAQPQTQAAPQQPQDGGTLSNNQVATVTGRKVDVNYEIVEGKNLRQASEDLQPRDRSRQSSDEQIRQIAQNLDPQRLGYSAEADRGAPIIGPDNIIESGNGRVRAINMAYDTNPQAAELYRQFLVQQGFTDAANFERPILVRRRTTQMTDQERRQFVIEANQSATMAMSSTEQSRSDTVKLTPAVMAAWRGGEVTSAANRDFVRQFIQSVVPQSEQNQMMGQDGQLSIDGKRRIENAMLGKAYENPEILAQMTESTDNNIRSISGSLLDTAGRWAQMREEIAAGRIPAEYDLTPQLTEAARVVSQLRAQGMTAADWVAQEDMLNPRDPATTAFVKSFYNAALTRAAGRENINAVLNGYVDAVMAQSTQSMFGDTVQPQEIIEQQTRIRNEGNQGGEQAGLFDVVGQGAENPGRRDTQRGRGQGPAALQGDRERATGQGQQPVRDQDTGNAESETVQAQNQRAETEDGAVENGRTATGIDDDALPTESAAAQADKNAGREANQRFRGTTINSLEYKVSFTDRQSIYRNAFVELGYDPAKANLWAPARQWNVLAEGLKDTYNLAGVQRTEVTKIREGIDQLLDAYRGMQLMSYVLELPSDAIGLEGTLGLVLRRNVEYLGAYYPYGGNIEGIRTETPTISLPRRSNSFAHEWGHAFDYWLMGKFSDDELRSTLSAAVREGRALSDAFPDNSKDAFVHLIRSLFFDKAEEANAIMELERKIEVARTEESRKKHQAKLDQLLAGASKARNTRSQYFDQQAEFVKNRGGDINYWRNPTEMLARAFEAYISFKVEGAGGSTEFIGKGSDAYQSDATDRLRLTFPKDADRYNIFRAFDLLFDAVREDALLNPEGKPAANMPKDTIISNPSVYYRDPINTQNGFFKRVFTEERDTLQRQHRANQRLAERPSDGKTRVQRYYDWVRATTTTNRGVLLNIERKMRRRGNDAAANAVWELARRVATDPGSGRTTFKGGVFNEAVEREIIRFENRLDRIVRDHNIDQFSEQELDQLRDVLTVIDNEPENAPKKITDAAAPMRDLFNDLHNYMTQAGLDVGYVEQGYLPRIMDEPVVMEDPTGFTRDAKEVYKIVFNNETPNFEEGFSEESLAALRKQIRAAGLGKDTSELQPFYRTVRQMRRLEAALRTAEESDDADKIDAAQAKLAQFLEENIDVFNEAYDFVRDIWSEKAANDWTQRILMGGPSGWESLSPAGNFMKQRKLPPEADKILTKWYLQDPSETTRIYLRGSVRKAEYNRRFGKHYSQKKGNGQLFDLLENMRAAGVSAEDVNFIEKIVAQEVGALRGTMPTGFESFLNGFQTLGSMALLGRVAWTSVAEPIAVGIQTGSGFDGLKAFASTVGELIPRASVREKRALARALGLVGSPMTAEILSNRFGGVHSESKKLTRASMKYYARVGLTGLTMAQRRSAMQLGINYFYTLSETLVDSSAPQNERDAARRELVDFGLQPSQVEEFANWMMQFDGRLPQVEDVTDVDGQLTQFGLMLSTGISRLVNQSIQNPKGIDRPFAANTALGRITYSLLSFSMAFFRNAIIKSGKKINREIKAQGVGVGMGIALRSVAGPFAALYLGHFLTTTLREYLLNPDKWEEEEKKGTLLPYLAALTFSRAGFTGMADPIYNAILSLKYQRDLSNIVIGAPGAYFFGNIQKIAEGFLNPNSDSNNRVETRQLKALYELSFQPVLAYMVGYLPGGRLTGAGMGASYAYLSSPAFKSQFAEWFVGPLDERGNRKSGRNKTDGYQLK